MKRKISAIIACYKDEPAIPIMADRLKKTFQKIGCDYEIIFVNDCSPDNSTAVLEQLCATDSNIKAIIHSRNFGSQNAFTSGMMKCTGDACVFLDGDLQDPPELIESFHAKWLEGFEVIYGVRVKREMSRFWEFLFKGFYRVFQRLAYIRVPTDAGDFSLIDRKVIEALKLMPERDRFMRGLRAWAGFKQTGVSYLRPERMFGTSTNNLRSNLRWAKKGIFSFSYLPLEMISLGALIVSGLAAFAMVLQIIARIFQPNLPHGITSIIVVCLFLGSIQLLSLAVIAEYIAKIFEEVKQRPIFIVDRTINFS